MQTGDRWSGLAGAIPKNSTAIIYVLVGEGIFQLGNEYMNYHPGLRVVIFIQTEIISVPSNRKRAIANAGFIIGLSAEHTKIEDIHHKEVNLKRHEKITLIPGYTDAAGMLHDMIYATRNDIVVDVWKTI